MKPLDLTTLFDRDDLAEARKARAAAQAMVTDARLRGDTRDLHAAQRRFREVTCAVVRLEIRR